MHRMTILCLAWTLLTATLFGQTPSDPMFGNGPIQADLSESFQPANEVTVPDDFPTIQKAINAAQDYWTIRVAPGTYYENLNYLGKIITIRSIAGPHQTVIDGRQQNSVVLIKDCQSRATILDGFTITNGKKSRGGGVLCLSSSAIIRNNIITKNNGMFSGGGVCCGNDQSLILNNHIINNIACAAVVDGGGIGCNQSNAEIIGNYIAHNQARGCFYIARGGGIGLQESYVLIANNKIMYNVVRDVDFGGGDGGGICGDFSHAVITNNLIAFNESGRVGGGISLMWDSSAIISNTTLYENKGDVGAELSTWGYGTSVQNSILWNTTQTPIIDYYAGILEINYCDIAGGWPGYTNIDADPLFVDPDNHNFALKQDPCQPGIRSPCVDAGNALVGELGFQNCSTRSDRRPDVEFVDLGFHYGPFEPEW